jgi:hypothetical protein
LGPAFLSASLISSLPIYTVQGLARDLPLPKGAYAQRGTKAAVAGAKVANKNQRGICHLLNAIGGIHLIPVKENLNSLKRPYAS